MYLFDKHGTYSISVEASFRARLQFVRVFCLSANAITTVMSSLLRLSGVSCEESGAVILRDVDLEVCEGMWWA